MLQFVCKYKCIANQTTLWLDQRGVSNHPPQLMITYKYVGLPEQVLLIFCPHLHANLITDQQALCTGYQ